MYSTIPSLIDLIKLPTLISVCPIIIPTLKSSFENEIEHGRSYMLDSPEEYVALGNMKKLNIRALRILRPDVSNKKLNPMEQV